MTLTTKTHTSIFSLIMLGSLGAIVTSGVLVGGYNSGENPPTSSISTRCRYLLFCGLLSFVLSLVYTIGLRILSDQLIFSVISHLIWLGVTIVLFVSGSAALTSEIRGKHYDHQTRLEILEGFAWVDSILLFLAFLLILGIGIGRRNGLTGSLLGGP
ncbi:hypothetical protein BY996DRAFT_6415239 [Phakopsora pachyrhizi]|uniref:MARVEL domain-containing protein n=1 Tax=Phakopsora pachyrhizi TaxID=170000 RepID=A0A0S1MKX5_PHAPC|nr:hypothetical protein BY996DRAFT_6415239 [Phakopsora pachyrhizi]CAH7671014.1 hypothetical protein PPACK8108_LOCUS5764 [Phakopsora pachyrhizi]